MRAVKLDPRIREESEGLWVAEGGVIIIVAFGGARTRRIVNWRFVLWRPTADGREIGVAAGAEVESILQTILAHESTKFTLTVQSGTVLEGTPERLTGSLWLRVDKYWSRVDVPLHRVSTGDYQLDTRIAEDVPWARIPVPWWKRALSRLKRLV